eukprot:1495757-Alexandrium_andersonii.AAC.1
MLFAINCSSLGGALHSHAQAQAQVQARDAPSAPRLVGGNWAQRTIQKTRDSPGGYDTITHRQA